MADIADTANELADLQLNTALLSRPARPQSFTGFCIWCRDEPVVLNSAYCSKDCGDDHEQYKRRNK